MYCGPNSSQMKQVIDAYRNNLIIIERDFRNMFNDFFKIMNEHRRAINVMSVLVNKAIGIEDLYNDPVKMDNVKKITKKTDIKELANVKLVLDGMDLKDLGMDVEHPDIKELAISKFPQSEFDELFSQTEEHLTSAFNIREMSDRLFAISSSLFKTYLWYNQNLDVQVYLESQLDKKYRINSTPVSRVETKALVEEAIEEGLRNNLLDFDF